MGKEEPGKVTPMKIKLSTPGDADFALEISQKLKDFEFNMAYVLRADRTKEQRTARKKLDRK